ncbi:Ser/Thr protein phosphatase [Tritrichomonas foetus]|uniref:protein-serine/threonine phosphatase n=1 Tax=Tritrichomonas foetus TaxID=1144522 RepID=A0A1J4KGZ7_9EUKA|nr:Ser/Thr protein phosphatase [Tritrichomonas foetus]|eukprot:OHT10617.1 Ser/Thr protein phosphatase [Tritrichomonas foetus]
MIVAQRIVSIYSDVIDNLRGNASHLGKAVAIPSFSEQNIDQLCNFSISQLKVVPSLLLINNDIVVVGDIHGNLHNLVSIFIKHGFPPTQRYLFIGNYVDYGMFSLETSTLLLALASTYPDHVFLLKGETESYALQVFQGFYEEVVTMYHSCSIWNYFMKVFEYLPVAAYINRSILCAHLGVLNQYESLDHISLQMRPIRIPQFADAFKEVSKTQDSDNDRIYQGIADKYKVSFIVSGGCQIGDSLNSYAGGRIYTISACEQDLDITVLPIFIGKSNEFDTSESTDCLKRDECKFQIITLQPISKKFLSIPITIPKTISHTLLDKKISPTVRRKVFENKSILGIFIDQT